MKIFTFPFSLGELKIDTSIETSSTSNASKPSKEQIINQEKEKKLKMFSNMHFSNLERSIQIKFL